MLLASTTVMPSYGQIKIQDHGTTEAVEWSDDFYELGRIVGEHVILVRTMEPSDGDVVGEVYDDIADTDGTLIYDGPLRVDSGFLSVAGVDEDSRETVQTATTGVVAVRVYVSPSEEPRRVLIATGQPEGSRIPV
jgi:hypothetical protein